MTNQEIFDTVVKHLHQQGGPARRGTTFDQCAYRGNNNTSCAIGCLIRDDEYIVRMEGKTLGVLVDKKLIPTRMKEWDAELLSELQGAHDLAEYDLIDNRLVWDLESPDRYHTIPDTLARVAFKFDLDPALVWQLWPKR